MQKDLAAGAVLAAGELLSCSVGIILLSVGLCSLAVLLGAVSLLPVLLGFELLSLGSILLGTIPLLAVLLGPKGLALGAEGLLAILLGRKLVAGLLGQLVKTEGNLLQLLAGLICQLLDLLQLLGRPGLSLGNALQLGCFAPLLLQLLLVLPFLAFQLPGNLADGIHLLAKLLQLLF